MYTSRAIAQHHSTTDLAESKLSTSTSLLLKWVSASMSFICKHRRVHLQKIRALFFKHNHNTIITHQNLIVIP